MFQQDLMVPVRSGRRVICAHSTKTLWPDQALLLTNFMDEELLSIFSEFSENLDGCRIPYRIAKGVRCGDKLHGLRGWRAMGKREQYEMRKRLLLTARSRSPLSKSKRDTASNRSSIIADER